MLWTLKRQPAGIHLTLGKTVAAEGRPQQALQILRKRRSSVKTAKG
jgi:hypothetical protein